MSVTMVQHPLSPYESESASDIVHCSQHNYTSTMLRGTTYFSASSCFPLLPVNPLEHCAPLSTFIRLSKKARKNPEIVQSFLLELEQDMPVMSSLALRNILADECKHCLSQSQIIQHWLASHTHWFRGNHTAITELRNAVLVGLDVEMFEHDHSIITELGMSILDPWKLPNYDANTPLSAWDVLKEMVNHHVRIKPTAHLVNGDLCAGYPDSFQFGNTSFVSIEQGKELLRNSFMHYDNNSNKRPVIFIGHTVDNDIQAIKDSFGLDLEDLNAIVTTIDTQALAVEKGLASSPLPISLGNLMKKYNISEPFLHNAGNDVVCTMIGALIVPSRQPPTPMATKYALLKTHLHQQNQTLIIRNPHVCLKCDSEFHTTGRCKNPIPRCEHCARDIARVEHANTHKTDRCVQHAKQKGQTKTRKKEIQLLPFGCLHCLESTDGERHKDGVARRHKAEDCPYLQAGTSGM